MPDKDGVTLDYRGYDGASVRTHFRFTSRGEISFTACAYQSGRLKLLGGKKKERRSPLSRLVPTIAPMVYVTATYIGAADDIGPAPIHGSCAYATARTADHCNALDVRRLELSQGGQRHC